MACDSVRRLCVRWCGQLVGCSGSGRGVLMKFKKDFPGYTGTSRQVRNEKGLRPRPGCHSLGQERGLVGLGAVSRPSVAHCRTWVVGRPIVWRGQTVKDSVSHTQELHIILQVLGNCSQLPSRKAMKRGAYRNIAVTV